MRIKYDIELTELENYFTCQDSFAYILYNGLESGNIQALYLRKHDRRIYFVDGEFSKGLKVIKEFRKKGWIL